MMILLSLPSLNIRLTSTRSYLSCDFDFHRYWEQNQPLVILPCNLSCWKWSLLLGSINLLDQ